ncbi:MAG: hypothetical protein JXB19_08510 [Bacteroidales bacterium]|nr:hypothetical protein [Bacteroidales bacterium]
MKEKILISGVFFVFLVLPMCEKETDNNNISDKISYIKTLPGGCHGQYFDDLKSACDAEKDTVICNIENDTLDIFIGLNYICCAPFISETFISNDSIHMLIQDTCSFPYQSCYCRCMCYYTWDFLFTGFENKQYYYIIMLHDPREEKPVMIEEGIIDLSQKFQKMLKITI